MINKLYKKILRSSYFRRVIKLKHAKCPILKLQTRDMFDIDLAFNVENGQAWIDFMKKQMQERPNLRPLILVLKAFLWSWKLHDTASGGIGSYLLAILVICYLQNHKDEENDLG